MSNALNRIKKNSPLNRGTVYEATPGILEIEPRLYNYKVTNQDRYYRVRANDTLFRIAFRAYDGLTANPNRYWHFIYQANQPQMDDPTDISAFVGQEIIIPDFDSFNDDYVNR